MTSSIPRAEIVIRNANIITMDPRQPRAQALAIQQGKFVAVGSDDDMTTLAGPGTRVLDLRGKTVLPGFIDAHIHVLNSGIRHVMAADCALPTIAAIQDALQLPLSHGWPDVEINLLPPNETADGLYYIEVAHRTDPGWIMAPAPRKAV